MREFVQKYLLKADSVPGTMLETRNTAENSLWPSEGASMDWGGAEGRVDDE